MCCSDRCPFVLLRIRLFTFSGGDKVFCADCCNPGCKRSAAGRKIFEREFHFPDQPGSSRVAVLQGRDPLCDCAKAVIGQFWVDEPEDNTSDNTPTGFSPDDVPGALVQLYLDQDPGRAYLLNNDSTRWIVS
jgi:hypothetical protein